MSKKSLIICLAVLAVMILGVGIAVIALYSGSDNGNSRKGNNLSDQERYMLLPAVPADAVLVSCVSDAKNAANQFSGFSFLSLLADSLATDSYESVASSAMTISLHYSGQLQALYVFDTGRPTQEAEPEAARTLQSLAQGVGMYSEYIDCSKFSETVRGLSRRSIVVMSESETLVKSSVRHLEKGISVIDASGFAQALEAVSGTDLIFVSNAHAKMLMPAMFSKGYSKYHSFASGMSQWLAAELSKADDSGFYMNIIPVFGDDSAEFMNVIADSDPGASKLAQILPSYTVSALSIPMKSTEPYIDAYQRYMDSKQSLQSYRRKQRDLEVKAGINPLDFVKRLDVKEVAKASFVVGSSLEDVNLLRIEREDTLLFVGTENKSFKDYEPSIHAWPYAGFAASVFGKFFELKDESCFTYIDGWVVSGSLNAIETYVSGMALQYKLLEYMADAGRKDIIPSHATSMLAYYSLTENPERLTNTFSKTLADAMSPLYEDCDYTPLIMNISKSKDELLASVQIPKLTMVRTKAPEFERDTTVIVPEGPFEVMNSGTGKMNKFYQNSHGSLCLNDENGKGLWGVPFKGKLCGTAYTIDYYENGKLQIIFGSGSEIYLIDRLGRFVSAFPIKLSKEILLGPDVYDFNNKRAYNIMVLHKDNTIEMYNLKGKKPDSWKSITAPETIKGLPERIIVGGNTFWVVRTSVQTLIYPFNGGTALTNLKADEMIRPDSSIEIMNETSVKVSCYDGKARTIKLK